MVNKTTLDLSATSKSWGRPMLSAIVNTAGHGDVFWADLGIEDERYSIQP
ncbi:hypothetical protein [Rhizobium leguminosarum]|nr:hypothetical protein [Rhizobium leguminosarum]MBY5868951.1 hypothetical protein [Rhizobium leguminosarum]